jgi:hypothetical protein
MVRGKTGLPVQLLFGYVEGVHAIFRQMGEKRRRRNPGQPGGGTCGKPPSMS